MDGGWKMRTAALAVAALGLAASACGGTTAVTPAPALPPAGPSPAVVTLEPTAGDPYHEPATATPASRATDTSNPASRAPAGSTRPDTGPDTPAYTPAD